MIRRWFFTRGLLAALLALLLAAPAPTMPMPVAPADFLAGSLCLADPSEAPVDHRQPSTAPHVHCTLCLTGLALFTPPEAVPLAIPSVRPIASLGFVAFAWFGPSADRPYASRAPPRIA